jgi:riboflavin-specific deaminase-like protein
MLVFSNLATSLDGKIATRSRELFHLGTPADRKQMQVLRKRADVVVMGGSTLRTYKRFCGVVGRKKQPANAVLSSNLEGFSPNWPFFKDPGQRRILLITEPLSPARLQAFEKTSEVILLKKPTAAQPLASQILETLKARGLEQVLVEGGGGLMWSFASCNLIDEYHVTLTPRIIGGKEAPSLVEGTGFDPSQVLNLKLVRCRRLGNELYLTYRKTKKRG